MTAPRAGALALLALPAILACRHVPERPAVIEGPSAETRAALAAAVRRELGGAPVTLADDALTGSSVLLVERTPRRDPGGVLLDGRSREAPERFRLLQVGPRCVLVREKTGARIAVQGLRCAPLP